MSKWRYQLLWEARLFIKQWYLFVLPVIFAIWFVHDLSQIWQYAQQEDPPSQDIYLYAYDFYKIQGTLTLGIAMFIGIFMMRRDTLHPAYEWQRALPAMDAMYVVTKYVVGLTYLSLYTICLVGVYAVSAAMRGYTLSELGYEAGFYALQFELSYAVTLALSMFLAVLIKNRIAYLIGFCGWIFGTFFIDVFLISRLNLYFLKTFHLNQFFTQSETFRNEAWGLSLISKEMSESRWFVVSFILLLMVISLYLLTRQRMSKRLGVWRVTSIIALILVIICYLPYGQLWAKRYAHAIQSNGFIPHFSQVNNQEFKVQTGKNKPFVPYKFTMFHINNYHIQITKKSDNDVASTVDMVIPTSAIRNLKSIPFTLYNSFHIKKVMLNGNAVPWKRHESFLTVQHVPDRSKPLQSIRISYEGTLFNWQYNHNEMYQGFVKGDNVFLPSGIAWYPVPGHQYLYGIDRGLEAPPVWAAKGLVHYQIDMKGFSNRLFATIPSHQSKASKQLFEGSSRDGIDIYGSKQLIRLEGKTSSIHIITTPGNRLEAKRFLKNLDKSTTYFNKWLGQTKDDLNQIIFFPMMQFEPGLVTDLSFNNKTLGIFESLHNNLDSFKEATALEKWLFGINYPSPIFPGPDQIKEINGSVAPAVRQAILYVYDLQVKGHGSDQSIYLHVNTPPIGSDSNASGQTDHNKEVMQMIGNAMKQGQIDKVKRVLAYFYKSGKLFESDKPSGLTYPEWLKEWHKVMGNE